MKSHKEKTDESRTALLLLRHLWDAAGSCEKEGSRGMNQSELPPQNSDPELPKGVCIKGSKAVSL